MDKLIAEVTEAVETEYIRAAAKFGRTNNSDHESYAILLEELEEAQEDIEELKLLMSRFWHLTRNNESDDTKISILNKIRATAIFSACEFIQVAAMATKASLTTSKRRHVKEFEGVEFE